MNDTATADFIARIEGRIAALGTTERAVSLEAFGHHKGIAQMRKSASPGIETFQRLAGALRTTAAYLAYGDGAPEAARAPRQFTTRLGLLPIAGEVAAGHWLEIDTMVDAPSFTGQSLAPDPRWPAKAQFALVVRGTSINRVAPDGALLHCVDPRQTREEPRSGDLVIVERKRHSGQDLERTAKRYRPTDTGHELWPDSTDARHKPIVVDNSEEPEEGTSIEVIGLVIRVAYTVDTGAPWER
ncbi:hypothetical protein LRS73_35235 (plasmid) [Methylobacterium currus]|uniref:LexA family protein n=1 Tax=Methylobacterium currus TaxID=2051553 RepID=UPI001E4926B9|nr:S24 family peptidase [Methylobacterium currus]UHC20430.1 hypothetical protein LRS73_35235 [Methylobacterium currus]